ncbi:hypothetical protein [Halalkalibacter krulwichiae]|uniref:GAF domain-containing protein n=1 Tax=Halalkalibacter krulwichiae TaxID=199441 RepID=A0A1X9MET7_9BACI|nr:hypothetical protein [Halalkalibacter krulwichiae]ARK31164.1 hypothetical protein BkAM31D_15615 [Halalkalibacter krulwichiae]
MDKSKFLDELRLELGLVRDHVKTLPSFYFGVTREIAKRMKKNSSISIYETTEQSFVMKACAGPSYLDRSIPFGAGILSSVAIKGKLVVLDEKAMQKIFMPFYQNHHLLGIIVGHIPKENYLLTEDDLVFVKEVGRFIEVQHEIFNSR